MTYLLDTDVCSYCMKRRFPALLERVARHRPGELKVSAISVFELQFGAFRREDPEPLLEVIDNFLDRVEIVEFDQEAARAAAKIRGALARRGSPIGSYDTQIAGHALSLGATLVTHKTRELERVVGLELEDWTIS